MSLQQRIDILYSYLPVGKREDDPTWRANAQCKGLGPDRFFPDHEKGRIHLAYDTSHCDGCPVISECLDYAIEHKENEGVYGGMTPGQRRQESASRSDIGASIPDCDAS